ncbi:MAG: hypothetical protein IPL92_19510 [Saprospiraceae bacterium]|nr:hypothetical protein [Candidatus Opimibacter iunctus]
MIHGEAISFLGDPVRHQGMDVAIFLQTNSLVEVIIEDDHDGSTLFNSIFTMVTRTKQLQGAGGFFVQGYGHPLDILWQKPMLKV